MRKGTLTRDEAIALVGEDAVNRVESENCDFTNRVQTDGDTGVEFAASVGATDKDGDDVVLTAYYYQDQESLDSCEDLGDLNWEIDGYSVA